MWHFSVANIKLGGQFSKLMHFKNIYKLIHLHKLFLQFSMYGTSPSCATSFMHLAFCSAVTYQKTLRSRVSLGGKDDYMTFISTSHSFTAYTYPVIDLLCAHFKFTSFYKMLSLSKNLKSFI